jgi:hypothetical protein
MPAGKFFPRLAIPRFDAELKLFNMKGPPPTLFISVWLVSLGATYWIGSLQHADPPGPLTEKPESSAQLEAASVAPPGQQATLEPANMLIAYLEGQDVSLADALKDVSSLSVSDARTLLNEAFTLPASDPNRSQLIRQLLSQIAETDPVAALEIAGNIKSLRDSDSARRSILAVWGRNDPAGALAWANQTLQNEPRRVRSSNLIAIYRGYAQTNPQAAFQQAMRSESEFRNRILDEIIETQIEDGGLQSARIIVDTLSDPELQNSLRRELVGEWAEYDPVAAANYVESLGEDASTHIKSALLSEWAESDPASAAAWLSSLPEDDPAVARASAAIIQEWTRYDLSASAEWLNTLPPSPELDRAVISYTFRAAEEDPKTAMTWAESIEDERRRMWMMERVAATWKSQAPESFVNYLGASDLTDEQRERLGNAQLNRGGRWGHRH